MLTEKQRKMAFFVAIGIFIVGLLYVVSFLIKLIIPLIVIGILALAVYFWRKKGK